MIDVDFQLHSAHRHSAPARIGVGAPKHSSIKPELYQIPNERPQTQTQPQSETQPQSQSHSQVRRTATVPIATLVPGESPRSAGQVDEHVARLAETDDPLPPILVERGSMRVIDGMHRLLAARLRGRDTIEVEFFEGSAADAFLYAVKANVTHGLPLSHEDRRAAAIRIISSYPHMSDRAIARVTGLGATTIASIRRGFADLVPQSGVRIGRDGRARPLDAARGRLRAAELFVERPQASLRQIAREAGVSPATAADVRKRLERGELPTSTRTPRPPEPVTPQEPFVPTIALEKLLRDPSLRHSEMGRTLLVILRACATGAQNWSDLIGAVPPHWASLVGRLAHQYARLWEEFAQEMEVRIQSTAADGDAQPHVQTATGTGARTGTGAND